jgi:ABC-type phosphate transport system substrate-binding protein
LQSNPALQAFVDMYVSDEGLNTAVQEVGYIPIPTTRQDETRATWASAA